METPASSLVPEEVFRPWRRPQTYLLVLAVFGAILGLVGYLLTHVMLESQIALGLDPWEVVMFISIALVGAVIVMAFELIALRRSLLAEGELRFRGSTLILSRGGSCVARDASEVRRIACSGVGADIAMKFSNAVMNLPGQWLPPGWVPTRRGWRTPSGVTIRSSREANPVLAALLRRRPDLKPRVRGRVTQFVLVRSLLGLLGALFLAVAEYPLMSESREALARHRRDEILLESFQAGRYAEACAAYRRALPDLLARSIESCMLAQGNRKNGPQAPFLRSIRGPFGSARRDQPIR